MWQVLIGAAIAGSTGFVAKRFLNPFSRDFRLSECNAEEKEPINSPFNIGFLDSPYDKTNGIFRFASSDHTIDSASGSRLSSGNRKSARAKCRVRVGGLTNKKKKKKKNGGGGNIEKRSGNVGGEKTTSSVCLKKPKTTGSASASNPNFDSSDQDRPSFSSALGICMMYMMSSGTSEISKLHSATEETAKVVQELKDELSTLKSLGNFTDSEKSSRKCDHTALSKSETKSGNEGEYASSVLTEEPEHEAVEIEQLEMELESELQKLNLTEKNKRVEECNDLVNASESYQCGGVSASELDMKLSNLLIEQQEGQINELEAELQNTQFKLQKKEAELQALKVCVRRLTEFPLLDHSDEEHEQDLNQDLSVSWSQLTKTDNETSRSIIGMKRPMRS